MGSILLVRHGQAAFGQDDYDVLSALGSRQAAELGSHWVRSGVRLDALYVGPRRRHVQTAEAMRAGAQAAGGELPPGQPLPGFDEFPFHDILRAAERLIGGEAAELRAGLGGADPLREPRSFDRLFMLAMSHWITGALDGEAPETFAAFVGRVRAALYTVMAAHGRGCTVAVVTSAGPMAAALQVGMALQDQMVLKLCSVLANTGLAELRYRANAGQELTVVSFNSTPHLTPGLVTYR